MTVGAKLCRRQAAETPDERFVKVLDDLKDFKDSCASSGFLLRCRVDYGYRYRSDYEDDADCARNRESLSEEQDAEYDRRQRLHRSEY